MNSTEGLKGFLTFLLLIGLVGLSTLAIQYIPFSTNTSSEATEKSVLPISIQIRNLEPGKSEARWFTEVPTQGTIIFSQRRDDVCFKKENMNNRECLKETEKDKGQNHIVVIENLEPGATYFYKISNENTIYPEDRDLFFTTEKEFSVQIPETTTDDDFSGFSSYDDNGISKPLPTRQVLGTSTSKYGERVTNEFKQAILFQNMKFDFNKDGQVNLEDYPLFVEFILNRED